MTDSQPVRALFYVGEPGAGDEDEGDEEITSEDWFDGTGDAAAGEIGEEEFLFGRSDTEEEATLTHANPDEAVGTTDLMRIQSTGDERRPKDLNSPVKPSARAVELHEYTHLPFRP